MRKPVKIALIVVGSVVAIAIAALVSVDIWASRVANKSIQSWLAGLEDSQLKVSVGEIHVGLLTGTIGIEDIYFATDTGTFDIQQKRKLPGMEVQVPLVTFELVNYYELLRHQNIRMYGITVHEPNAVVWLDEKYPERCLPVFPKDTSLSKANIPLHEIGVNRIRLSRANAKLKSVRTSLLARADSLTAEVHDLMFNLTDTTFAYNDSNFLVKANRLYARLPDGSMDFSVNNLKIKDEEGLKLGKTRIRNIIGIEKMAERAQEPVAWIDVQLRQLQTAPFNPIRKALAQDLTLDSIYADVEQLHVKQDNHIPPKRPYSTPQEFLLKLPVRFEIKSVEALTRHVHIELTLTGDKFGQLELDNINAHLRNVTNRPKAEWRNYVHGKLGDKGHIEAIYTMYMTKEAKFECQMNGHDIELDILNPFMRPLVGITCESHVDKLETHYTGDKTTASGDFLMMFHGMEVAVHKEDDIAIKPIQQHAKTIENLANSLVTKSNPSAVDTAPRRYMVEWKNDPWKPYPLFVFGPCINGAVETLLPGLYVHKQIRETRK